MNKNCRARHSCNAKHDLWIKSNCFNFFPFDSIKWNNPDHETNSIVNVAAINIITIINIIIIIIIIVFTSIIIVVNIIIIINIISIIYFYKSISIANDTLKKQWGS